MAREVVNDAAGLAKAVKDAVDEIVIEGKYGDIVIKVKATGFVAWGVAIAAIGIAVGALLAAPGTAGTSAIAAAPSFGLAAASLGGGGVAVGAISIAVAAGGVGALTRLRDYEVQKLADGRVLLKKR